MNRSCIILLVLCTAAVAFFSCTDPSILSNSLEIPQEFEITAIYSEGCELEWQAVENADYYIVKIESKDLTELQTTECTILVDNLKKDIQYEVSVCACNEVRKSPFSQKLSFEPGISDEEPEKPETILPPPENVRAKADSSSSIKITWNAVESAESYILFFGDVRSTSLQTLSSGETESVITNLKETVEYVFKVKAVKGTSSSDFSKSVTGKPLNSIPKAPIVVKIDEGESSLTLFWNEIENAVEYCVFLGTERDSLEEIGKTSETSFTVYDLPSGTEYFAAVQAENSAGKSPLSTIENKKTLYVTPDIPENLCFLSLTNTSIELSWDDCRGTEQYTIYYGNTKSGMINSAVSDSASFILTNLNENSLWYFKVKAENSAGSSSWSEIISARTLLSPPEPATINTLKLNNSTNPSSILIRWNAAEKAAEYNIYRSVGEENNFILVSVCTGTQYMDGEAYAIKEEKTYSYKVETINSGGSGGFSEVMQGTVSRPALFYDVTGKGMSGYYEFYLDEVLLCSEVLIDYNDPLFTLNESVEIGEKIVKFRFKKLIDDEWGSWIMYEPIQFSMGGSVTCKCSSLTNQTKTITYALK